MFDNRKTKTLYLRPSFITNLNLKKDYRLVKDLYPPKHTLGLEIRP